MLFLHGCLFCAVLSIDDIADADAHKQTTDANAQAGVDKDAEQQYAGTDAAAAHTQLAKLFCTIVLLILTGFFCLPVHNTGVWTSFYAHRLYGFGRFSLAQQHHDDENNEEILVTIDNDEEYERIGNMFLERLNDMYE